MQFLKEVYNTKYGEINSMIEATFYPDGSLYECNIGQENIFETRYGKLIPQYNDSDERKRTRRSCDFYKNGNLKVILLENQTNIETPLGTIPVEKITFYEGEEIKRIFPLNGKLNGFWTWMHEYKLAKDLEINTPIGKIKKKIMSVAFYKSGNIRSISLWPNEILEVVINNKVIEVRNGISFYESGEIESIEPLKEISVKTNIGELLAYDPNPLGIHADSNSLSYYKDGSIKSLKTISNEILVFNKERFHIYKSVEVDSLCGDNTKERLPLDISFLEGEIKIGLDTLCLRENKLRINKIEKIPLNKMKKCQ